MTDKWSAETVGQHMEDVRQQFLEVLGQASRLPAKLKQVK